MDWTMITVFTVLSVILGVSLGFFHKSIILGLFFALIGMGLTLIAALILITGYDGIFVWIAGPLIMVGPFYIFLLIKYPDKLKELDDKLGFKKKKR